LKTPLRTPRIKYPVQKQKPGKNCGLKLIRAQRSPVYFYLKPDRTYRNQSEGPQDKDPQQKKTYKNQREDGGKPPEKIRRPLQQTAHRAGLPAAIVIRSGDNEKSGKQNRRGKTTAEGKAEAVPLHAPSPKTAARHLSQVP
jgi:hypothetical protein